MTFKNNQCPVCGRTFTDDDDIVVCPECGTPHHRDCWQQLGHCANRARHGDYQWENTAPAEEDGENRSRTDDDKKKGRRVADLFFEENDAEYNARMGNWTCRTCGRENPPEAEFCENCGASRPFASRFRMAAGVVDPDAVPPNILIDGIPAEEEAQYIGPGATRYLFKFLDMEKRDSRLSWNWGAALLGPLWCFYRKLYSVGFLYLVATVVVSLICLPSGLVRHMADGYREVLRAAQSQDLDAVNEATRKMVEGVSEDMLTRSLWQEILSNAFSIGGTVLFGIFGNYLYKRKIKKSILTIRTQASDMQTYLYLLARKGRVNFILPAIFAFFYLYTMVAGFMPT